jgi:hypothetical protein
MTHPSDVVMPMEAKEFNTMIARQRRATGSSSEFFAAADISSHGAFVSFPTTSAPRYDIVADLDGRLFRVQVKTLTRSKNDVKIPTGSYRSYSSGRPKLTRQYKRNDFDLLAGVDRGTGMVYYVHEYEVDYSVVHLVLPNDKLSYHADLKQVVDNFARP